MPLIKIINNDTQVVASLVHTDTSDPVNLNGAQFISVTSDILVNSVSDKTFLDGNNQAVTVVTLADTGVVQQGQIVTQGDTAGSLNNKYFLFSAKARGGASQANFYVWYNNGSGVDPALPLKTAIEVDYTNNASDTTIAGLTRTAIATAANAIINITGAGASVNIFGLFMGRATAPSDGPGGAATLFTITDTTPGVASNLLNTYFKVFGALNAVTYVFWNNVNSEGTDPALAGTTSVPVLIAAGAANTAVGSAIDTAVGTLSSIFTKLLVGHTETITLIIRATASVAVDGAGGAATLFTIATPTPGVNSAIDITANTITVTAHPYFTGQAVQLSSTGTLPAGLSTSTTYYIIVVNANTIGFATTLVNANLGTKIDLTDQGTAGSTGTISGNALASATFAVQLSDDVDGDPDSFATFGTPTSFSGSGLIALSDPKWAAFAWLRILYTLASGNISATTITLVKGPN